MALTENITPQQAIEREELRRAYRAVFETAAGKRVLFDILEQCETYGKAFTGDNNATNFRLGLQEAGKRLIGKLDQIDARMYPQLLLARADLRMMDRALAEKAGAQQGSEDDDVAP